MKQRQGSTGAQWVSRRLLHLILPLWFLAPPPAEAALQETSPSVNRGYYNDSLQTALPDSLFNLLPDSLFGSISYMEPLVIMADPVDRHHVGGQSNLDVVAIGDRVERNLAELGTLLPSTRVSVNSRGESQFMVRGAPERHLRVFFDGIPLTLPWDERADLSLLPVEAVAQVTATRGPVSVLDGYGAMAGRISLGLRNRQEAGAHTIFSGRLGEGGERTSDLLHLRRSGKWSVLAALAQSRRDGFPLPDGLGAWYNQGDSWLRNNSDLRRQALTLRLVRDLPGQGELALTLLGTVAEKGVPPEIHLADARFWRYPDTRRLLFGFSLARILDRSARWHLISSFSLDFSRLEIREYDDASYLQPHLAPGIDYEIDDDHSLYSRVRLTRARGRTGQMALQGELRISTHHESLILSGPHHNYSQRVVSLVGEYEENLSGDYRLRIGGGWERAVTPQTGGKPTRGGGNAGLGLIRLERDLGRGGELYLTLSRRSRFPSMRELFSGALGKFKPNPQLGPERQDQVEMGGRVGGKRFELGVSAYLAGLRDGIEKVRLVDQEADFQRINVGRLRSLGLEFMIAANPRRGLRLSAQHSFLQVRQRSEAGSWSLPTEDRPDYLSYLSLAWTGVEGWRLHLECSLTGARHSADTTEPLTGLRRLPAAARCGGRLGWALGRIRGPFSAGEVFLQVSNLLDELIYSQTGLVEPGRVMILGLRLELDR